MQAQTLKEEGEELLLEAQGKIAGSTVKEITPQGVRLRVNFEGQVTGW